MLLCDERRSVVIDASRPHVRPLPHCLRKRQERKDRQGIRDSAAFPECFCQGYRGSSSHLGNSACLMLSDILLKEMQGRCFSAFQEDDGDGKVPVSAFTRRDGHWPG